VKDPKLRVQIFQGREIVFNLSEWRGAAISREILKQFRSPYVGLS
jgi:hypothetical protein